MRKVVKILTIDLKRGRGQRDETGNEIENSEV
jgi:hypothetical protein